MLENLQHQLRRLLFTPSQQQAFLEDVSKLIEDGVPANKAIETIERIAKGNVKEVAQAIMVKISEGQGIAEGMSDWFPPPIVEIIRAGEVGGTLAKTLTVAARSLTQQSNAIASLLSSITYPLAVIIMGMIVSVFIKNSVFISFSHIKPITQWPSNGRLLVEFAIFIEHWWWASAIGIVIIIIAIAKMLHSLTGNVRTYIDKAPLFSLYRDITAARFMETLGLLLSNGIILKRALQIMQHRATPYLTWHLYLMEYRLSGGRENIAEVIDTGLIKGADILRLKVIAKGKGFEHALARMGKQTSERNLKNIMLTGKITGGLILALGALYAAFMIFAIYGVGTFVGT